MSDLGRDDWADLLAFHLEAGVDVAVGEAPVDRFAESAAEAARRPQPAAAPSRQPASPGQQPARAAPQGPPHGTAPLAIPSLLTQAPDEAVMSAREAARTAQSLEELRAIMEGFEGCALKRTASRLVFSDGNPRARVMFVGEAPGRDEDQQGLPFVGRSGRLLDLMMGAIGLDRSNAYITNIVPWRPPGNRDPSAQESAICLPFIARHIELVDPDILVCLGKPSAHALLATTESITRLRGRFMDFDTGTRTIRALATFHPAYLLRTPIGKRLAWRDMLAVESALGGRLKRD